MATLEDKILGEKLEYYCSSDDESNDEDEYGDAVSHHGSPSLPKLQTVPESGAHMSKTTSNTGPKGVIKDWQRFKQLEIEKREDNERERLELAKKLSMTCQSALDEEEDPELADLLSDDILLEFAQRRMQEMLAQQDSIKKFGRVIDLKSGVDYLDAIDNESKNVTVILHVYEDSIKCCRVMNDCLEELCLSHLLVKFCKMSASTAGLSMNFKAGGVPALLIYKAGELVGNFVQLGEEFGTEFVANDVESFLLENNVALSSGL